MATEATKEEVSEGAVAKDVYHERQVRQMCALHVLNNLFQASRLKDLVKM